MKKYAYIFLAILFSFIVYILVKYPEFQKKARESEVKLSFEALWVAEDSYYKEWKRYTSDLSETGYKIKGSNLRHTLFTKKEELSSDDMAALGVVVPFIRNDTYLIIGMYEDNDKRVYFSFDHEKQLTRLAEVNK